MEQLTGGVVSESLVGLSAAADQLMSSFAATLASCSDADVIAELHALETLRRRLASLDHAMVTALESRSIPATVGCASTSVFLQAALRLSPHEARARVRGGGVRR